jgi:anti-sigma B factor antagonist
MFSATLTEERTSEVVIRLEGELDLATTPDLAAVVGGALASGASRIVLDAARLEFADSTGLAGIARLSKQASDQGSALVLCNCNELTAKVLALTGLDTLVEVLAG